MWTPRTSRHLVITATCIAAIGIASVVAEPATPTARPSPRAVNDKAPTVVNPHGDIRIACETCHMATSWTTMPVPSRFDHRTTGYPLIGKHQSATCKDCHGSPVFARVSTGCVDCHHDVHEGRNDLRCQECHSPERWVGRADAVRRHATTGFPLRGAHALLECSRCHGGTGETNVARISSGCITCHASQFAAARNPDHSASGFSTECQRCHDGGRTTWGGAGFDHASTGFPLTGAHRTLTCTACHTGGSFTGTPSNCSACHMPQYNGTNNPNHAAAGFSTQCATCHTTATWSGATFDHDALYFRIYSGRHRGRWSSCTACHQNQASYHEFTCFQCHSQSQTDPHHGQVTGYRYESTACYACHRNS